ncbi:DUF2637 domain-containing protein [Streptomyces sp. KL116D]|uniref:DUF2637 domain-containing protein n=1 Tax=Streptomyces sp. KL116D TaxID=3045152 RepID=UPI003557AE23
MAAPLKLTRTHRILVGVVIAGAVVIAGIGFAGSYAAVRELALEKGFGNFSYVLPIGIDAGICVLLALDLLLTWIRIPFPLLRQTAWLLTAATIAFNGAAAWPDPLGVGMHAVIPILFVVSVEAARHAIGRIADITADKHMEGVRITRWLLSPVPTFLLWRRMKLWELRSYEAVIKLEQERLVYQARLHSRFGRAWRRKAPVESLMPLRLARYGVPLSDTAPAGLAAAGIEPQLLPPKPQVPELERTPAPEAPQQPMPPQAQTQAQMQAQAQAGEAQSQWFATPREVAYQGDYDPNFQPPTFVPEEQHQDWYEEQPQQIPVPLPSPRAPEPDPAPLAVQEPDFPEPDFQEPDFPVPNGAGGTRPLGDGIPEAEPAAPSDEELYQVFRYSIDGEGMPTQAAFQANVEATYGAQLAQRDLIRYHEQFSKRLTTELLDDHIA